MIVSVVAVALMCFVSAVRSGCLTGEIESGGSCYSFSPEARYFDYAEAECHKKNAELVSLDTKKEFDFIRNYLKSKGLGSHWTSAERTATPGFHWSTGDHIETEHYGWGPNEPNNQGGKEGCVELRNAFGYKMNDASCATKNSYICEHYGDTCPTGFVKENLEKGCYYFHNKNDKTWEEANEACLEKGADLISIVPKRLDMAYVRWKVPRIPLKGLSFWTSGRWTSFVQQSGHALHADIGWRAGQPNNYKGYENCAHFAKVYAYYLNDLRCAYKLKYICERPAGQASITTKPVVTPTAVKPVVTPTAVKPAAVSTCPAGYLHNPSSCSCYWMPKAGNPVTYLEAKSACTKSGSNLVTYDTAGEFKFILNHLTKTSDPRWYWVSAVRRTMSWASGAALPKSFPAWNAGEPNNYNNREGCVEMRPLTNRLNDVNCLVRRFPACEIPLSKTPSCGDRFGSSCYYFNNAVQLTAASAEKSCVAKGGHLVSIETIEEHRFVAITARKRGGSRPYWTSGKVDRQFRWYNNKPVSTSMFRWGTNEPNNYKGIENCVEVRRGGYGNDLSCTQRRSFICEKRGPCSA